MRSITLVLTAAAVATALVAVDYVTIGTAGAAVGGTPAVVNRDAKSDRLQTSSVKVSGAKMSADASIHISVDHEQGMTTVIKRAPVARQSSETDFAFLASEAGR